MKRRHARQSIPHFRQTIAAETAARTSADIALQNSINSEASARQSADTTLQQNIDAEAATRAATDTTLQNNIGSETVARQTADANLQEAINAASGYDVRVTGYNFGADMRIFETASTTFPGVQIQSIAFRADEGISRFTLTYAFNTNPLNRAGFLRYRVVRGMDGAILAEEDFVFFARERPEGHD